MRFHRGFTQHDEKESDAVVALAVSYFISTNFLFRHASILILPITISSKCITSPLIFILISLSRYVCDALLVIANYDYDVFRYSQFTIKSTLCLLDVQARKAMLNVESIFFVSHISLVSVMFVPLCQI